MTRPKKTCTSGRCDSQRITSLSDAKKWQSQLRRKVKKFWSHRRIEDRLSALENEWVTNAESVVVMVVPIVGPGNVCAGLFVDAMAAMAIYLACVEGQIEV